MLSTGNASALVQGLAGTRVVLKRINILWGIPSLDIAAPDPCLGETGFQICLLHFRPPMHLRPSAGHCNMVMSKCPAKTRFFGKLTDSGRAGGASGHRERAAHATAVGCAKVVGCACPQVCCHLDLAIASAVKFSATRGERQMNRARREARCQAALARCLSFSLELLKPQVSLGPCCQVLHMGCPEIQPRAREI